MVPVLSLVTTVVLATWAPAPKAEMKRLQGEWVAIAAECGGKPLPEAEWSGTWLSFSGTAVAFRLPKSAKEGEFELVSSWRHRAIDFWWNTHRSRGQLLGGETGDICVYRIEKGVAIYSWDRGRLKLCLVWDTLDGIGDRPSAFRTAPDDFPARYLYTFEHAK